MDASVLDKYPYIVYFIANRLSMIEFLVGVASIVGIFVSLINSAQRRENYNSDKYLIMDERRKLKKDMKRSLYLVCFFLFLLVLAIVTPNTNTALNMLVVDMIDKRGLSAEEIKQITYDLKVLIQEIY